MFFSVDIPLQLLSDFYSVRIFICILRVRKIIMVVYRMLITDDTAPVVEVEIFASHYILLDFPVVRAITVPAVLVVGVGDVVFAVIAAAVVSCWFSGCVFHCLSLIFKMTPLIVTENICAQTASGEKSFFVFLDIFWGFNIVVIVNCMKTTDNAGIIEHMTGLTPS